MIRAMLAAGLVVAPAVAFDAPPAHAQSMPIMVAQADNPFANFFRRLFSPPQRQAPPQAAPAQRAPAPAQRQRQRQRQTTVRAQSEPAAPAKDADARRIVVFGDFFATGLRGGLEASFEDTSSIVVAGQGNASSGLVRDDYFDWPAAIRAFLADEERRVDVAVIMVGGNDRQAIRAGGQEHALRSDRWRELYTERIDTIIELFLAQGVPVYWVGLPPVQSNRMSQDYAFFNDLYRERAFRFGIHFVDVWNGFVDEDGRFAMHGPDVNGEHRQLRNEDGLNFTGAGNRKLAHFVARDIRRDIGSDGELTAALPIGPIGPQPFVPGEEELESGVGQVLALTGAPAEAMGLAGGPEPTPDPPDDSAYYRTIILGETPEPVRGRSDDFAWPREGAAAAEN